MNKNKKIGNNNIFVGLIYLILFILNYWECGYTLDKCFTIVYLYFLYGVFTYFFGMFLSTKEKKFKQKIISSIKNTISGPLLLIILVPISLGKVGMTPAELLYPFIFTLAAIAGAITEFVLEKLIKLIQRYPPRMEGGGY